MREAELFVGILFSFIGVLAFLASIFNWKWFFETQNSAMISRWFGRKGARIVYSVVGVCVTTIGILFITGLINS